VSSSLRSALQLDVGGELQETAVWIKETRGDLQVDIRTKRGTTEMGYSGISLKEFASNAANSEGTGLEHYLPADFMLEVVKPRMMQWLRDQAGSHLGKPEAAK
jgi:hypothetical protein